MNPKSKNSSWTALVFLSLMAFSAPIIAALIHSICVFQSGIRFYNAELWQLRDVQNLQSVFAWLGGFGLFGAVTFLIILPFQKTIWSRWIVWICAVALWTIYLFKTEVVFL